MFLRCVFQSSSIAICDYNHSDIHVIILYIIYNKLLLF